MPRHGRGKLTTMNGGFGALALFRPVCAPRLSSRQFVYLGSLAVILGILWHASVIWMPLCDVGEIEFTVVVWNIYLAFVTRRDLPLIGVAVIRGSLVTTGHNISSLRNNS